MKTDVRDDPGREWLPVSMKRAVEAASHGPSGVSLSPGGLALPPGLAALEERLAQSRALGLDDLHALLACPDVLALATLADAVARRKWAGAMHYARPLRLPLAPICDEGCPVCPPLRTVGDYVSAAREAAEVHLVALSVDLDLDFVERVIRALRAAYPDLWLQGLTAGQVAALGGGALDEAARRLQAAGLDGILGTDEEIFTCQGRRLVTSDFESALATHQAVHHAGMVSVATLRYGYDDDPGVLAGRLAALRELQQRSAGFSVAAPIPEEVATDSTLSRTASGYEDVRICAVCRLFLHNVSHVRVPWMALGLKMGQVALAFGADDVGWAPLDPHVVRCAHPATFLGLEIAELERAATAAGRHPRAVDGAWRPLEIRERAGPFLATGRMAKCRSDSPTEGRDIR